MKLAGIVAWYQKKIGTYDKQPWEQGVEHRILSGFVNTPSNNVTARTEYIDVDLVRGSTFPKAKPKQSLFTVLQLAVLRYLLLPLYAKWWIAQTSARIFAYLLFLYVMQMLNWIIYTYNVNRSYIKLNDSDTCDASDRSRSSGSTITTTTTKSSSSSSTVVNEFISITDLLVPMSLSLLLSLIHSQIVATASSNLITADKHNKSQFQQHRKRRERKKRRKSTRSRSALNVLSASDTTKSRTNNKLINAENRSNGAEIGDDGGNGTGANGEALSSQQVQQQTNEMPSQSPADTLPSLRKRNVNWRSPIKSNYAASHNSHSSNSDLLLEISGESATAAPTAATHGADDDGFESLNSNENGKSSSGEEMTVSNNNVNGAISVENESTARNSSGSSGGGGGSSNNKQQQYVNSNFNSAYSMGKFGDNADFGDDDDVDDDDIGLITGANELSENNCDKLNMRQLLQMKRATGVSSMYSSKNRENLLKTYTSDDEEDEVDGGSQPLSPTLVHKSSSGPAEWIGITTNSEEDCSYSSADNSDSQLEYSENNFCEWNDYITPILNSNCAIGDRINCTFWDGRDVKKVEMSVLDISSSIIKRVEAIPDTCDYVYMGLVFSLVLSLVPAFCRLCEAVINSSESNEINFMDMPALLFERTSFSCEQTMRLAFGETAWQKAVLFIDFILRFSLAFLFFFLLAVAERTFKQRFLYAKLFSHLTSSRRARKSELPHFRLNKVRNIKTWLSVRSYLKRRGPQRSVDVIVSGAFILTLLLLAFLSVEWLKDSVQLQSQHMLEALIWSCALGCFLLRFMTLGTKINRKYRSISVLITEQINLYLLIEQKPHNKDELMVSNSVLKLAADLLKELESPFKISGLSANPYLYTTIKVVILSALSGVLSEMLGFKLKLHKIKIK